MTRPKGKGIKNIRNEIKIRPNKLYNGVNSERMRLTIVMKTGRATLLYRNLGSCTFLSDMCIFPPRLAFLKN